MNFLPRVPHWKSVTVPSRSRLRKCIPHIEIATVPEFTPKTQSVCRKSSTARPDPCLYAIRMRVVFNPGDQCGGRQKPR
jgi:hypothetical protein